MLFHGFSLPQPRNPAANDLAITSILRLSKYVKAPLPLTDVPGVVLIPQL